MLALESFIAKGKLPIEIALICEGYQKLLLSNFWLALSNFWEVLDNLESAGFMISGSTI